MKEGTIKKFEFIDNDDKIKVLNLLESVWGIGPSNAKKLYDMKIRSI